MTSFINDDGDELDYNGNDFALSKQTISIFDLKILSNVSVNLKITGSEHNRAILNFYRFNQVNGNQLISQVFSLVQDGNKIDRGRIILIEDEGDEINAFFASGNFEWFSNFNFLCSEIRTTRWDRFWGNRSLVETVSSTEGIIFPFIDWNYKHEKFSKYISNSELRVSPTLTGSLDDYIPETYPCLYIHTLVKELANHSGVNITGTLLEDNFFKSLILTPPGANFEDPVTGEQVFDRDILNNIATYTSTIVKPEMIAPRVKAIDFIKWLSVSFGCVVSFDPSANSISLDILARYNKADAEDWSEYYRSHTEKYNDVKKNNHIKFKKSDDPDIEAYNKANEIAFGDLNIESGRDDESERTIYTSPFAAVFDKVGTADLRWACPYVPFVVLTDGDSYAYSSVTDVGAAGSGSDPDNRHIRFNGTGFPFDTTATGVIVRIVDNSGLYDGFHTGNPTASASSTTYSSMGRFKGTSAGTIYIQSAQKTSNQYVLVAVPGVSPSSFTISPEIVVTSGAFGNNLTTVATAYFSKPYTPYSVLNNYNKGLAFGEINESFYNDISLKEAYLNPLTRAITEPTLKTKMVLPVAVFARFTGSRLIYLNTGKLNGYFIVEKIEQYKDSVTEVVVYISNFE